MYGKQRLNEITLHNLVKVPFYSSSTAIRSLSNVVTDEQKKDVSPPPDSAEAKPNEELEKLNKEISELTTKNTDLLVSTMLR